MLLFVGWIVGFVVVMLIAARIDVFLIDREDRKLATWEEKRKAEGRP